MNAYVCVYTSFDGFIDQNLLDSCFFSFSYFVYVFHSVIRTVASLSMHYASLCVYVLFVCEREKKCLFCMCAE